MTVEANTGMSKTDVDSDFAARFRELENSILDPDRSQQIDASSPQAPEVEARISRLALLAASWVVDTLGGRADIAAEVTPAP